jgi:hypothetical protein
MQPEINGLNLENATTLKGYDKSFSGLNGGHSKHTRLWKGEG